MFLLGHGYQYPLAGDQARHGASQVVHGRADPNATIAAYTDAKEALRNDGIFARPQPPRGTRP
ncbi:hypothetical protein NCAST_12_00720 [Nocardia asteroides NBRC 15531]|uniref:Uncharacterized protein n=1 Tax=Nocardia asteroides NBRC 15531 TaxID=1110697 RepID=U5EC39_NOCAS|nr:hypothetical protein NCAST_12_00720 [Nocardia asteroides NBRC 15531]